MNKYLYHFTDIQYFMWILKDGFIKLCDSNLIPPKNEHFEINERGRQVLRHDGDDQNRVVWLTSEEEPDIYKTGLSVPKVQVRIAVKNNMLKYIPYSFFADKHNMDAEWRKEFEKGHDYKNWYVSETPITVTADAMEKGDVVIQMTPEAEKIFDLYCSKE